MYIGSQIDCATSGGLAEAAFWVFVMQDIQFALAYRKPLRLTLSPFAGKLRQKWAHNMYEMDRDWTHRAIWLLAETINYCYARNTPLPMDTMDGKDLKMKIREWETERPESFRALHVSPPNPAIGRAFPVVWFTNASHGMCPCVLNLHLLMTGTAMAVQHICMAKVLIQEYELQTMGLSAEGRANGNVREACNIQVSRGTSLTVVGQLDREPEPSLWHCVVDRRRAVLADLSLPRALGLYVALHEIHHRNSRKPESSLTVTSSQVPHGSTTLCREAAYWTSCGEQRPKTAGPGGFWYRN